MELGRAEGLKIGVFQPVTIWPFPEEELLEATAKAKAIFVPELNLGQLIGEVQKRNPRNLPIFGINRVDSYSIHPGEILNKIKEAVD